MRRGGAGRVGSDGSPQFGIATKYGRGLAHMVLGAPLHVRTLLIQFLVSVEAFAGDAFIRLRLGTGRYTDERAG